MHEKIASTNWQRVTGEINDKGYTTVSQFLPAQFCEMRAVVIGAIIVCLLIGAQNAMAHHNSEYKKGYAEGRKRRPCIDISSGKAHKL